MLRGIDVPPALVVALEMHAARGDDAEQPLQRRERDRGLGHAGQAGAFAALEVLFVLRRQAVAVRRDRLSQASGVGGQFEDRGIAIRAAGPA